MSPALTLAVCAFLLMGSADTVSRRARQLGVPVGTYMLVQCPFFIVTAVVASAHFGEFSFSREAFAYGTLSKLYHYIGTNGK